MTGIKNFSKYKFLSFDCYGTLIDWENGILSAVKPVLSNHNIKLQDKQILESYAKIESKLEKGKFVNYKEILRKAMQEFGIEYLFIPSPLEVNCTVDSLKDWKSFPDTVEALNALKRNYKLVVISNVDDDLFALTAKHLKVKFDLIITAEQVKSYKPSLNNFKIAIKRMNVSPNEILHIAQSIYHDIIPAKKLGLSTVWVNRRKGKQGFGATLPAKAKPDIEVGDLKTLVSIIGLNHDRIN